MSHAVMAANARHGAAMHVAGIDLLDDVLMTLAASVFRHAPAAFLNPNWFVVITCRKRKRMKEAVLRFREILRNYPRRRVAIIARRYRTMARLDPSVEVALHDVTVGAGRGIIPEVRSTFGIDEGVRTKPRRSTDDNGDPGGENPR